MQGIKNLVSKREGETKLGETVKIDEFDNLLTNDKVLYIIIGIEEDDGPVANLGKRGAEHAYPAFLQSFLNVQDNRFLRGGVIGIAPSIRYTSGKESVDEIRNELSKLDEMVSKMVTKCIQAGKFPILIGGGHNNSYGAIRGVSEALKQSVNCVNLDPHADFRELEGRHSGNGFSYAMEEGFLSKYMILGLHQSYNSESMLERMDQKGVRYSFYDDYLDESEMFNSDLAKGLSLVSQNRFGIELDLDSIEYMPSSAMTPSGISIEMARKYIRTMGSDASAVYLHICEGAPELKENGGAIVGKTISYLVSDFIKKNINVINTNNEY